MLVLGGVAIDMANSIGGYERITNGYQVDGRICGKGGETGNTYMLEHAISMLREQVQHACAMLFRTDNPHLPMLNL